MYTVAPISIKSISFQSVAAMASASSEHTFYSNIPCEDTKTISAQSARMYKKDLDSKTKRNGKPLTPAEIAFRMKKLKGYGQTLAPKWRRKFEEKMTDTEAKMAAEADRIIENENKKPF